MWIFALSWHGPVFGKIIFLIIDHCIRSGGASIGIMAITR